MPNIAKFLTDWMPRMNGDIDRHIGGRIRELRNLHGWQEHKVARGIKVTWKTYCEFETGRRRIPAAQLFRLARLFNVRVAAFFEQTGVSS